MTCTLRPSDVAERWQCSDRHVFALVRQGRLRAFRLGGKLIRIPLEAVEEFECSQSLGPSSTGALTTRRGGKTASVRRQALRTKDRSVAEQALKSFALQYEIANRPDNITVEYVWTGYWKSLGVKPAAATMRYEGKAVLPFFGNMAADAITEESPCISGVAARGRPEGRNHLDRARALTVRAKMGGEA